MDNRTLTLDFYNNSYFVRSGVIEYAWFSLTDFIADTSFPYDEAITMVSYEPGREIYAVIRTPQDSEYGLESTVMQWVVSNFNAILETGRIKQEASIPVLTLEIDRLMRLSETDWIVQRHQEETLLNIAHKLTNEEYTALLTYKQQLRDLTDTYPKDTPTEDVVWPVNPLIN